MRLPLASWLLRTLFFALASSQASELWRDSRALHHHHHHHEQHHSTTSFAASVLCFDCFRSIKGIAGVRLVLSCGDDFEINAKTDTNGSYHFSLRQPSVAKCKLRVDKSSLPKSCSKVLPRYPSVKTLNIRHPSTLRFAFYPSSCDIDRPPVHHHRHHHHHRRHKHRHLPYNPPPHRKNLPPPPPPVHSPPPPAKRLIIRPPLPPPPQALPDPPPPVQAPHSPAPMELPHSPSPHDFHFPEYFHSPRTLEAVTHPVEAPRSPALVEFPGSEDGHLVTRLPSLAPSPSTPSPVLQAPPPPVAGTPPPPVRRALPPPPGRGNICSTDDTRAHA
ncbi:hypothetical protein SELMODRAFT_416536 [Selaginella moellendorffii]|uniref:Uncharacterized protein n=2 Tax=Selaginella moellendorffii TaxID=88036 RepID=D8RZL3_SELML|nr:hypothetical protein SELMODRAFT_416536 [Selaginella moellendorffii]